MDRALERLRTLSLTGEMRQIVSEIADFILTADFGKVLEITNSLLPRREN
jgi:hypothetical protein